MRLISQMMTAIGLVLLTSSLVFGADKQAVPSAENREEALKTIRSIFKKDYESEKREDIAKLAADLLTQAGNSSNDITTRYALYVESIELAHKAGDAETAFKSLDAMAEIYEVDGERIEKYVLGKLFDSTLDPNQKLKVYQRGMSMVNQLEADRDFDTAEDLLQGLAAFTRKAKNRAAILEVSNRRKSLDEFAKKFRKIAVHQEALEANADDPEANLAIGKFECFELGNWTVGLAHLAKGSDAKLSALAAETLAKPDAATNQFAIASDWWELGEEMKGEEGDRAMAYAASWYTLAEPMLSGLDRVLAKKRIAAAPEVEAVVQRERVINLLSLVDLSKDGRPADRWEIKGDVLNCTRGSFVPKVVFPYKPPEEYDVRFLFTQPRLRNGVGLILPNVKKEDSFYCHLGGSSGDVWGVSSGDESGKGRFRGLIAADTRYAVEVNVRKNRFTMKVNGKVLTDIPTDYSNMSIDSWHTVKEDWPHLAIWCDDPTAFTGIQVIEITGQGEFTRQPE